MPVDWCKAELVEPFWIKNLKHQTSRFPSSLIQIDSIQPRRIFANVLHPQDSVLLFTPLQFNRTGTEDLPDFVGSCGVKPRVLQFFSLLYKSWIWIWNITFKKWAKHDYWQFKVFMISATCCQTCKLKISTFSSILSLRIFKADNWQAKTAVLHQYFQDDFAPFQPMIIVKGENS